MHEVEVLLVGTLFFINRIRLSNEKLIIMAKSSGMKNAPSTTGNKSGRGRSNNAPKSSIGSKGGNTSKLSSGGSKRK